MELLRKLPKKIKIISIFIILFLVISPLTFSQSPTDPSFNFLVEANQLAQQGFLREAEELYTAGLQVNPENYLLLLSRAQVRYQLWDYENAIRDFSEVIRNVPNYYYAYNDRGLCYAYIGRLDRALVDFTRAIELEPEPNNPAYYYRGSVYFIMGDERFREDFNKSLQFMPDAYLYDQIASFLGLNENPNYSQIDLALEYSTMANEMMGWNDLDILYTFAELNFQKSFYINSNGELAVNQMYVDRALHIMDSIFNMQNYLRIEQNGYFIYRSSKMYEMKQRARN